MNKFPALLASLVLLQAITIGTSTAQTSTAYEHDNQALELGVGSDQLSSPYADWQLGYVLYEHRTANNDLFYARYQHTERFDQRDNEWLLGTYIDLNDDWQTQFEIATSPSHNVRPKFSGSAWLSRKLDNGYIASVGAHHSRWQAPASADILSQGFSARLERYVGNWRWSYTARLDRLQGADEQGVSHTANLSYYYDTSTAREPSNLTFAINSGEELEKINPVDVVVTDVQGLSLYGLHNLSRHWAWRWSLTWQEQGYYYDRTGALIGVRYRF